MSFKKDFVWGAATAAYQIEGAAYEDGKGLSVWDVYAEREGKVYGGHTGDVACDHYHRLEEDLDIMAEIGLKAYRFSVSWPRIMPKGTGEVNLKGIEFYNRLIDGLLARGITPFLTLYHWDTPYELYKKGDWLNRDMADWFEEYAGVIMKYFGDRVNHFFTINEPQCFIGLSYINGKHAPGIDLGERDIVHMIHHTLLAHGKAVKVIRNANPKAMIGYAPVGGIFSPKSDSKEDLELARMATFAEGRDTLDQRALMWSSATFNDPAIKGEYPKAVRALMDKYILEDIDEDLKVIAQPMDFLGVNVYQGMEIGYVNGEVEVTTYTPGFASNKLGWPITEDALYYGPKFLYDRYQLPIYITENGLTLSDWVSLDGKVHDPNRIDFLTRYITRLEEASDDGADIAGYFQWSLMDNFEWAEGYKDRFGLVYVDYETQKRTLKDSAYWYREVINTNFKNTKH